MIVVIAIIIILASALLVTINPSNTLRKTRDSRRIEDLSTVNKALTLAIANGKITIPLVSIAERSSCNNDPNVQEVTGQGWVGGWTGSLKDFISTLPKDPLNADIYCYYFAMSATGMWELATTIESYENANLAIYDGGSSGTSAGCTQATMPNASCRYEIGTDVNVIM